MLLNGKRSPSPHARRSLMEVLGVENFDLLLITEPAGTAGRGTEDTGASGPRRGPTDAKTAASVLTAAH